VHNFEDPYSEKGNSKVSEKDYWNNQRGKSDLMGGKERSKMKLKQA